MAVKEDIIWESATFLAYESESSSWYVSNACQPHSYPNYYISLFAY